MSKTTKNRVPDEVRHVPLNDTAKYFYTHDLGCAAAAQACGFMLVSLDKENPKKVQFIFRRDAGIDKVVSDFWADCLEVRARAYFDNLKALKNRIYSE